MNHLATVHSTPLDHARTSRVHNHTSTTKSKSTSGTSLSSLKDKLKSLRRKSTPSSPTPTTHHVKLNGLTSDRQVRDPIAQNRSQPQPNGDQVYGTAFGNVRSGWLQHPTSATFFNR